MLPFLLFYLIHILVTIIILIDIIKRAASPEDDDPVVFMMQLILCWVPFLGILVSIMLWLEYRFYTDPNSDNKSNSSENFWW